MSTSTTVFVVLCVLGQILAQDSFSPQLNEAVEFCGGLEKLTDGLCPIQDVQQVEHDNKLKGAKNVKLCKAM